MKKRLISFLLAVSMILSILPVGAFAAYDASNNITDITFSADGVPTKTSGTGWTYKNNTLEIKSGFSFANNADYPLIKCDIDNYGTIMGGVYKGKVTNHGKISFGIFAKEPENKDGGTGTYYKISSSTGEELTFNSKLTANQAYTLATQAVKLTAPAGKVFSNGKNTYTISYFSGNIDVVLSDPTRIDLTIGNDGYPVNSNGGTQPVYNGNGWTYQTTTLESGSNKMALVIDEGTDTSALNDKVIRVPVKCAGTLTGGLYTKSVELSGNGKITGGFFTNDVTNAGLSSVAIEHDDTFTVDSFPNVTLSKVYTKASPSNTITLKLTKPQQLQHVGAGYSFSQPSDFSSVTLTVPKGDTVILYKRAPLTRALFKVTAPDIKVGDPVNVTVEPAVGVVGLGKISIAGYYRAENSGQLLDADYVSKHADRYRVVVRVGVGTVYEGASTYSAGNVGGDNSWFFTVSEAPSNKILDTDGYPVGSGSGSTDVTNDTWRYDASRNLLILSDENTTYTLENVEPVKCSISNAGTLKDSSIKFASDDLSLSNEFGTLNNCNVEGLTYNYNGEISGGTYTAVYDTNIVSGHTNATVGVLVADLYKPEGAYTIQGADSTKILSICGLTIDNVAQDKAIYVKTSQSTITVKTSEAVTHINGEEFSNCTDKVSTIDLSSSSADKPLTLNQKPTAPAKYAITRKVSDDTPNLTTDVITVKVNDSEAVEAAENDTITLSLDTAQLPESTTFTGWSVTSDDGTVEVTNGTSANNASFTMPGKAVTVTYTVNISTPVETEYEITHQHGNDLPDFSVTVDGVEVSMAKANATVTLSLDTAQLPENTTFAGWSVTAGNDTVDVTNGTSASNASFTMPGKAVTVTYTVNISTPVETEYEITRQHSDDLPDFSVTVENAEVTAAKANATVTLSLDTTQLPEGTTFAGWSVTAGNDTVDVTNGTSANNASFTMPGKAVTVSYTVTTISDPGDTDTAISSGDDAGAGVAIVLGGAAIGGAAYLIGTQVYLTSVLPEGASIPTNRQQLADLLWTAAGKPQPASTALFTDISAEAADSQKAARWCVEQGLLKDTGSTFKPDKHTFRPQVIKAWNDLQAKLNPQK